MRPIRPLGSPINPSPRARLALVLLVAALGLCAPVIAAASAIPGPPNATSPRFDNPDWLSDAGAAQLDVGIDVLVPSEPPAPFSGEPAITASSGYYNLYWLISGSPPTFLSITGQDGGTIPAYSKYDRNVELTVNASVNGADAYHDQTPIYDLVYWQVGSVVYSVESQNMTGTDSLSLANALETLTPPAPAPTPTDVPVEPTDTPTDTADTSAPTDTPDSGSTDNGGSSSDANSSSASDNGASSTDSGTSTSNANSSDGSGPSIVAPASISPGDSVQITVAGSNGNDTIQSDSGIFTATNRDSIIGVLDATLDWEAPSPNSDQIVTFKLVNDDTGKVDATAQSTISTDPNRVLTCPTKIDSGKDATLLLRGSGTLTLKSNMGAFAASGVNADFSSNGGGASMSGTMPAAGAVQLDWTAPKRTSNGTAKLTVTDGNGAAVGDCSISVVKLAAKTTATPTAPAVSQDSDGTDLRVTGLAAVSLTPAAGVTAVSGANDGSGMTLPATPPPGSTPTPSPTKAPPTPTKTPTPSVQPTSTLAPTIDTSGMVSQVIGPDGGQLSCPSGATLIIPKGALTQLATVTLKPVDDSKLPVRASVSIVPKTAFDVTAASMDGRSLDFKKPVEFSIALSSDKWRTGTTMYEVDGVSMDPVSNASLSGNAVTAPIENLTRYVAGVPVVVTTSAKRSMAKLIMAAAALVFILSMIALGLKLWLGRRSTMTVGPRRLR